MTSPLRSLARLYRDRSGYEDADEEELAVELAGSDALYGELMPRATAAMFRRLQLGPDDVFYDLGSGIGKVAIQAAISRPIRRVVGIEFMPSRHEIACEVLGEVERDGLLEAERCDLWCADFMRTRLPDATVVYTCSTAFPVDLIDNLAIKVSRISTVRTFVSLQELDPMGPMSLVSKQRLATSWKKRATVYVYERRR